MAALSFDSLFNVLFRIYLMSPALFFAIMAALGFEEL
jgi:hypothetical protein